MRHLYIKIQKLETQISEIQLRVQEMAETGEISGQVAYYLEHGEWPPSKCPSCDGSGKKDCYDTNDSTDIPDITPCEECGGQGVITDIYDQARIQKNKQIR